MRFQVPQNLDVPDTIFLGLDFRQLIYLGGAVGLLVFLFLFVGVVSALFIGGPVAVLAGFLSFFSYNNQKFITLFQALIRFFSRKRMYVWRRGVVDAVVRHAVKQGDSIDGEFARSGSYSQRQKLDKIREMNANLVFSDDGGYLHDDLDTAL